MSSFNNSRSINRISSSVNSNAEDSSSWDQLSSFSGYTDASGRPIARIAPTPRAGSIIETDEESSADFDMMPGGEIADSNDETTIENHERRIPEYVSPEARAMYRERIAAYGGPELSDRHLNNLIRDVNATRRLFFSNHGELHKNIFILNFIRKVIFFYVLLFRRSKPR